MLLLGILVDLSLKRYDELKDAIKFNQDIEKLLISLEARNRTIFACNSTPKKCLERPKLEKVGYIALYMILGGIGAIVTNELPYPVLSQTQHSEEMQQS